MKPLLVLSVLLTTIISSIVIGYPFPYYIYLVHELILFLVLLWFFNIIMHKKWIESLLFVTTFSFVFFFLTISPLTLWLAPDYSLPYTGKPLIHVDYLATTIGPRLYLSDSEEEAAHYIERILRQKGLSPEYHTNVTAVIQGKKEESFLFCAHFDTVADSPGADDNASGVAVLLELDIPESPQYTFLLTFFTGEEQGLVESTYMADTLQRDLKGVICVDTVGVGEDLHISCLKSHRFTSFWLAQLIYGLSDEGKPSIGPLFSDHVPFNRKGIPAVGITRSTNRMYPHIHSEQDTAVCEDYLMRTAAIIQKVIYHVSYSENPYAFVVIALLISIVLSASLSCGVWWIAYHVHSNP
ncbi:MAG: M28 family peptidase [Candidatus Methanofastidiosia archaeon]